ncbi:MAG: bifunctional (p)ppGpp synthetase/guanosine-3',5'-bis(diphosphate) 3'-pyrophosphohydrolase [Lachnospiraceae bacterium]|nr:bifunctional (p)ppGpp synthetase/guanosine-3',5'-bis(diphosphate) 3'-pyrophosphohydrolase [Lachnospiraceae bacterium]
MEPQDKKETIKHEFIIDDGRIESLQEFLSPEQLYNDLIVRVRKYHPSDDITLIEKAYNVANEAHKDQMRKSGEPYIIHPLYVAIILADLEMDKETIVAGILHDVVEDTIMTYDEIAEMFGTDVANLVDGVTKLGRLEFAGGDKLEEQAENLRKMFLAMAKDIRVIMIKLADRLHNMRTLKHMRPEKQQEKARETLDIYAPIAQRLGISKIKVELDDLSLKYLEPDVYYDLVDKIAIKKNEREAYVQSIVDEVSEHIHNAGIKAEIDGRVKHFFSIYKKMKNQGKSLDQIYDLFAVRIIVDNVKDCYAALGVIHEIYKPIPGRFKDYIAMPKDNMYQSLHTTLIGSTGQPFEIQIRTYEMHKTAEYGIAAHWKYKEVSDGKKSAGGEEEKLAWLRQILEWQKESDNNREFMHLLKSDLDLFSDSVYCFTPTGEVKHLPAGSNTIDFAYSIHSAVGNRMVGAKVNGKLVSLDYVINNGDVVQIITSNNATGPSRDWLTMAKSTLAKNKINQWFKNEFKEENIVKGKELLLAYCKAKGIQLSDLTKPAYTEFVMRKYGFHSWDALLAAVGHGGLKEGQIINKMWELYEKDHKKTPTDEEVLETVAETAEKKVFRKPKGGIVVEGVDDVAVRFGKCCSPIPGDDILGFVTRGRGVSIHRVDCVNVINLPEEDKARLIEAQWQQGGDASNANAKYLAEIIIYAYNRNGLLADVAKALTEKDIDIVSLSTKTSKKGISSMQTSFEIASKDELDRIIAKIMTVESVVDVERTSS